MVPFWRRALLPQRQRLACLVRLGAQTLVGEMSLLTKIRDLFSRPKPEWRTREEYFAWKERSGSQPRDQRPQTLRIQTRESWTAIDFETANSQPYSACALGIALVERRQICESKSWLIRPPSLRFNKGNIAVHGITAADVETAPTFLDLWPKLSAILASGPLLAHNAGFDLKVLAALLEHYELSFPPAKCYCTLEIARKAWPSLPNHRLSTVAAHLGVDLNHHEAESDARASAEIAILAAQQAGETTLQALSQCLGTRTWTISEQEA